MNPSQRLLSILLIAVCTPALAGDGLRSFSVNPKPSADRGKLYIHLSNSLLVGRNSDTISAFSYSYLAAVGYKPIEPLSVGLGSGLDRLEVPIMPLFCEVMYKHPAAQANPFALLRAGYGFAFERDWGEWDFYPYYGQRPDGYRISGGIFLNAMLGLSVKSFERMDVNVAVGYRYQMAIETMPQYLGWQVQGTREIEMRFRRIEVMVGFVFR